jgi:hypothetical protein
LFPPLGDRKIFPLRIRKELRRVHFLDRKV